MERARKPLPLWKVAVYPVVGLFAMLVLLPDAWLNRPFLRLWHGFWEWPDILHVVIGVTVVALGHWMITWRFLRKGTRFFWGMVAIVAGWFPLGSGLYAMDQATGPNDDSVVFLAVVAQAIALFTFVRLRMKEKEE